MAHSLKACGLVLFAIGVSEEPKIEKPGQQNGTENQIIQGPEPGIAEK
jgi:hypothetical protein